MRILGANAAGQRDSARNPEFGLDVSGSAQGLDIVIIVFSLWSRFAEECLACGRAVLCFAQIDIGHIHVQSE